MKRKKAETVATLNKACLKLWSACVIARDKTCRQCGDESGLTAHHIRSVTHQSTRFDLENGMALSWKKVHFLQHSNPERFMDIIIDIIGQAEYDRLKAKSLIPYQRRIQDYRDERDRLRRQLKALKVDYGYLDIADEVGL